MSTNKNVDRSEVTKFIKANLKKRTGRDWSVTGGRGTAWGWLRIEAPKSRRVCHDPNPAHEPFAPVGDPARDELPWVERPPAEGETAWYTSQEDRVVLAEALGIGLNQSSCQGVSISPDSWDFYMDRAENGPPPPAEPEEVEIPAWALEPVPDPPLEVEIEEMVRDCFINVRMPKLNKRCHVQEYLEQLDDPDDYRVERAKVTHLAGMTAKEYDALVGGNLMAGLPWLAGRGGCGSTADLREVNDWMDFTEEERELWKAESYVKVVEVVAPDRPTVYLDPQGHGYARYVAFPLEDGEEDVPEESPDPLAEMVGTLLLTRTPGQVLDVMIRAGIDAAEAAQSLLARMEGLPA